ncbi:MAG: Transcriptional regulator, IclR family [uncultured Paraburkholderia sp.]|uniref:IclR family transcriptional regulator domain-containing protein n=1 Tax=uncultured Paraburkholderia sp. TaxID=1822466 RepID=UPI00259229C9|nr:IclR family transcriptional regulator C-terminal domain-containing protein [uncultured Paraburkholderia sp.]CAH2904433.1 MAG: Transcriptional regulator, IclR family [uncultured Paraburkholderia sp.]CAH2943743.1 MAG: Transcriptional regulator, IclR family [uncultured Paraburkholderia sp.]
MAMDSTRELPKQDFAQTLARGLACLEVLADATTPLGCSDVASAMSVSRAAARRILLTLVHLGYVAEDRGQYSSSPKVLSLGRGMLATGSLWSTVAPEVLQLADRLDDACSISVLENLDILFVCRDATRRIFTSRLGIGDRLPAHCSASGKVLLANLPVDELDRRLRGVTLKAQGPASVTDHATLKIALSQVRQVDYALAIDEMETGTLSLAVPLRERSGKVIAAMSFASHRSRRTPEDLSANVLPQLQRAASRVEATIRNFQDRGWVVI